MLREVSQISVHGVRHRSVHCLPQQLSFRFHLTTGLVPRVLRVKLHEGPAPIHGTRVLVVQSLAQQNTSGNSINQALIKN